MNLLEQMPGRDRDSRRWQDGDNGHENPGEFCTPFLLTTFHFYMYYPSVDISCHLGADHLFIMSARSDFDTWVMWWTRVHRVHR